MNRRAVIVGVGEAVQRQAEVADALEPVDLMAQAIRSAVSDCGVDVLEWIETLDLIGLISWRYKDPVSLLAQRLGIQPARMSNASMGGETPIRLVHEAALAVTRGDVAIACVVGGEAMASRGKARKSGAQLPWTPAVSTEEAVQFPNSRYETASPARKLGMLDPANIYPFYEMACEAAWNRTPGAALEASARLWAKFAAVAAANPSAWIRTAPDAQTIMDCDASNRPIAWPYPKFMVANPSVNQAAATLIMEENVARELGIPDDKMIYVWGGAAAEESEDYLGRDSYEHSTAQAAVLDAASEIAGGTDRFDHLELYSCFPIVPKMAMRHLGLDPENTVPTVTGGLTFFGGPLNNYMSHAVAAMVRTLREQRKKTGLLYGQGGYVNKHHALVVSGERPDTPLPEVYRVQDKALAARGPQPQVLEVYSGPATIETYTVTFARDREPLQGVVIARTPSGGRVMARVMPEDDGATMDVLLSRTANAVGATGFVRQDVFGKLVFSVSTERAARSRTQVSREAQLTIVTIDRPAAMNSFDKATNVEMAEIFDEFESDPEQWVAIVTGAGDRAFSAGNDLRETARLMKRGAPIEIPDVGYGGLTSRFGMNKPVIAAVNGVAMGGGFEVALACDIIIAADTARFALPEPKVGLAALAGGLLRLPSQIGMKRAMGIILTGREVSAQEAFELGFVNEVVPSDELMDAARRWASQMLAVSPMSLRASKEIVQKGAGERLEHADRAQHGYPAVRALFRSADMREGPTAFAEKRKPVWKGR